jgi:hypothetical protein
MASAGSPLCVYDQNAAIYYLNDDTRDYCMNLHDNIIAGKIGFASGNHYSELDVPEDLIASIGYVIGREGFYFREITRASGVMTIFFNPTTHKIEITSGNTRFRHAETAGVDPSGATVIKPYSFDLPEWIDGDDADFFEGCDLITDARQRLVDRFDRCRSELASRHEASAE